MPGGPDLRPWAIAITITTDGAFWSHAIGTDLAPKIVSGAEGHFMWPGYHTALLPITLFPASLLFGGALQAAITRRNEPGVRFAIAWFLPAFIAFELFPTKLPHYPLPTFGGLIWLCALSLDMPLKLWAKIVNIVLGLLGGLVLTVIAYTGYRQFGSHGSLAFVIVVAAATLAIAGLAAWLLWRDHKRTGFGFLLAAGILGHLGIVSLAASLTPLWMSRQMEQALVHAHLDPRQGIAPGPVATLGYSEPSFVFTMGTSTELLSDDAQGAVTALSQGVRCLLSRVLKSLSWRRRRHKASRRMSSPQSKAATTRMVRMS